jgi:hypothetical protein
VKKTRREAEWAMAVFFWKAVRRKKLDVGVFGRLPDYSF